MFVQLEFNKNVTCRSDPDIFSKIPSWELTYPPTKGFLKMLFAYSPFRGICHRSLEGIQDTKILQVVMPRSHNRKTFPHFSPSRSRVRLPGQRLVFAATNPELQDVETSKGRVMRVGSSENAYDECSMGLVIVFHYINGWFFNGKCR